MQAGSKYNKILQSKKISRNKFSRVDDIAQ